MKAVPVHTFRANGLDTLRASAITLVFMNHYMGFVSGHPTFGWASVVGWAGVALFFILSGYLIANQLLAGLARVETLAPQLFYARRCWILARMVSLYRGAVLSHPAAAPDSRRKMGSRPKSGPDTPGDLIGRLESNNN